MLLLVLYCNDGKDWEMDQLYVLLFITGQLKLKAEKLNSQAVPSKFGDLFRINIWKTGGLSTLFSPVQPQMWLET